MQRKSAVVVATNAFGMGINKPDVRLVLHYNLPGTVEAYYQEAGRAGRDGLPSKCTLLWSPEDVRTQEFFIAGMGQQEMPSQRLHELQRNARIKLDAMQQFARTFACRRKSILEYFGDHSTEIADCVCDNCQRAGRAHQVVREMDAETSKQVRILLSAVARTQVIGPFGITTIADVVTGSSSAKMIENDLHNLSVYGLMKGQKRERVVAQLQALVDAGLVDRRGINGNHLRPVLELTVAGAEVMREKRPIPPSIADAFIAEEPAREEKRETRPKRARSREVAAHDVDFGDDEMAVFNRLRAARKRLADENGYAAFVIASNAMLKKMVEERPRDIDDLAAIKGFGASRAEKYGEEFLKALRG
jgi:ATP-dependent DNA helicase RecQ